MATKAISIAILADARDAVSGMKATGAAADNMGADLKRADTAARNVGDGLDKAGSASSQAAGGLGDLGGALSGIPGPIGAVGSGMETLAPLVMGATGAADLAALAHNALKASFLGSAFASARNAVSTVASTVATTAASAAAKAAAAAQAVLNAVLAANPIGLVVLAIVALVAVFVIAYKKSETFRRIVDAAFQGIKTAAITVFDFLKGFFVTVFNVYKAAFFAGVEAIKKVWAGIVGLAGKVVEFKNKVIAVFAAAVTWLKTAGANIILGLKNAIINGYRTITGAIGAIKDRVTGALSSAWTWLKGVGQDIMSGLVFGINTGLQWVRDKVSGLGKLIPDWLKKVLGISSPSKVMAEIGVFVGKGFVKGLTSTHDELETTAQKLADLVVEGFKGGQEDRLLGMINRRTTKLWTAVTARDKVVDRLSDQQTRLDDMFQARGQVIANVAGTVAASFRLVTEAEEGGSTTIAGILARAQAAVRQAITFHNSLAALRKRGLNANLLNELAQAGPQAGAATAQALLRGSASQLGKLNASYAQLGRVAQGAGNIVGIAMYDAGIRASQGLVKGLASQQRQIEATMLRIATAMQSSIRRALGIRSPSKVFRNLGEQTILGFVQGFASVTGADLVGTLSRDLQRSAVTMSPGTIVGPSAGAAGGTVNITVNVPPTADPASVGRAVVKSIKSLQDQTGRTYLLGTAV